MRTINHRYKKVFTFQWHLTITCQYNCAHCYCYDPETYAYEKNGIEDEKVFQIIDSFELFYRQAENHYGFPLKKYVVLTGGDPLFHPLFKEIVRTLSEKGYGIGILGVPDTMTDEMISFLKNHNVKAIQFSLDGLGETHDTFRNQSNSFWKTIDSMKKIQNDFHGNIMYTVCKENIKEFIPLARILAQKGIKKIDFARVSYIGNASSMELIEPDEYREFLENVLEVEKELEGSSLTIGRKDNLWKLLYYEKGLLTPPDARSPVSGCPCGFTSLTVLSDGTLFICRRFLSRIGKLPEDNIFEIYLKNEMLQKFRKPVRYEWCSLCKLKNICRGCPAVGASYFKELNRRDPQCWGIAK